MYLDKIELQFENLKHKGFKKKSFLVMNVLAAYPVASSKEEGSKIA